MFMMGRPQIKKLITTIKWFCSQSKNKEKREETEALVQTKQSVELMEDTYQKIKMQGLRERDITGVDSFQKDILSQNKFDLLNPKIEPKIASISTTIGLQFNPNNYMAEINLGKIKLKNQNQVFLSEVDPYNIPEYYQIIFDSQKQMSLVGTKTETSKNQQTAEMSISTRKAFEQKSAGEISRDILGFYFIPQTNNRLMWKQIVVALALTYTCTTVVIQTVSQVKRCQKSIREIENERMKQLLKIKRQAIVKAMISNPDMRII